MSNFWIEDLGRPIKALTALFDGLSKLDAFIHQFRKNKRFSDLLGVLKILYFSPEGTRGILTKIANGDPISDDDIAKVHRTVSDDTNINAALEVLVLDELRRWPELSVVEFEAISYLRFRKADLRGKLARYAKSYQLALENIDRPTSSIQDVEELQQVSRQLLEDIENFNAAIETIDSRLRGAQD